MLSNRIITRLILFLMLLALHLENLSSLCNCAQYTPCHDTLIMNWQISAVILTRTPAVQPVPAASFVVMSRAKRQGTSIKPSIATIIATKSDNGYFHFDPSAIRHPTNETMRKGKYVIDSFVSVGHVLESSLKSPFSHF